MEETLVFIDEGFLDKLTKEDFTSCPIAQL